MIDAELAIAMLDRTETWDTVRVVVPQTVRRSSC